MQMQVRVHDFIYGWWQRDVHFKNVTQLRNKRHLSKKVGSKRLSQQLKPEK
jgi:hypothetical protein